MTKHGIFDNHDQIITFESDSIHELEMFLAVLKRENPDRTFQIVYSLEKLQREKQDQAWALTSKVLENSSVSIVIPSSNETYLFGLDQTTRSNIETALVGIANGIYNYTTWVPKGYISPIIVTPEDIKHIGKILGLCFKATIQAYFVHKKNIWGMSDSLQIINYDVSLNWPDYNQIGK
jgi:hypothetical protein